jgi:threonine/homoserine/homoserine lactone efflux protein
LLLKFGREWKMYEMIGMLTMAFLTGLTGALAPGPTLVATVNSSLKYGWTAGPKIATGHAVVESVIFLLIVGGANVAMQQHFRSIHFVGGLALIAFGILTLKGAGSANLAVPEGKAIGNPYLAGMITSGANPYFWFWWLSIGSAMVLSGLQTGLIMAALLMICHWGADFGWYLLVSTSLDRGKGFISEKSYKIILGLCGGFLISFGLYYLSFA